MLREIALATIEERLRPYGSKKHVAFAPRNKWGQINGAWPHFVRKRIFSCRKWGLSSLFPLAPPHHSLTI